VFIIKIIKSTHLTPTVPKTHTAIKVEQLYRSIFVVVQRGGDSRGAALRPDTSMGCALLGACTTVCSIRTKKGCSLSPLKSRGQFSDPRQLLSDLGITAIIFGVFFDSTLLIFWYNTLKIIPVFDLTTVILVCNV
jgi:hypothetical protein